MYKIQKFYKFGILFAFFSEFVTIYPFYNLIFKENGISPFYIGILLATQKIAKMLFDIPTGMIADKYSKRGVLMVGVLLKTSMLIIFWRCTSFEMFLIGMIFWGVSMSCFFGNESAYIYDFLRIKRAEKNFPVVMGYYYATQNIAIFIASYVASCLYEYDGVNTSAMVSIFMTLVAVVFGLLLPRYKDRHLAIRFPKEVKVGAKISESVGEIFNVEILFLMFVSSISIAVFIFFFDLNTLIMNNEGYSAKFVGSFVAAIALLRIFGNALSGYITKKTTVEFSIFLILAILILIVFGSLTTSSIVIFGTSIYLIAFSLIDIVIITRLQQLISSKIRATIMSIISFFSSIFLILIHIINGFIADYSSYSISIFTILSTLIFLIVVATIIMEIYIKIFKHKDKAFSS